MNLSDSSGLLRGPKIEGYDLVEQLYLGSRTAVYRGIQRHEKRRVVIKVLRNEFPSFAELVQFRNQYTIAKSLSSPGLIQPLCLEALGNSYALVVEDWDGISLGQYIQQQSLELLDVLVIGLQLAEILQDLSQQQVVHKDIKPANILINPESKQVKLIDFSIASSLPKETQNLQSPNVLEGTLAYMAPEQTGRMNRGIDYRADFYALGVTLYQFLSGTLPFVSEDPLELVHCHIAKMPKPVNQINPQVPEVVAAIVTKLMAKNAEDRYQSAIGLQHDLQECLMQWRECGAIVEFELGQRDLSDRFLIPEKLYGRETEVQTLLEAFDRIAQGNPEQVNSEQAHSEFILVAGFSGIGKTAIVNEIHKPITRQNGYFIRGKFDQFNRNIPLSAFVQALRDLMGQLLSESDGQLKHWETRILEALGENGQVLIEVIPELERIIGAQMPVPELSGAAAQNRFNLLFQNFIQVFTSQEHPLAIFLDDLQWADHASLKLIQVLMAESTTGHLLLIGAYRDNEVFAAHPLMLTLDTLTKAGTPINTIALQPLNKSSLNQLIADTLHCTPPLAKYLTELVMQKTQGNPFFATQFLKTLYHEKLITFDPAIGHWQYDCVKVRDAALTDDVVEFMAMQLQKLPEKTQSLLKLAACIGAQFDLNTLSIIAQQPELETATSLWEALREGLILPISEVYKFYMGEVGDEDQQDPQIVNYKFLHDRVQQAAYSLIPEAQKSLTHVTIGRLLRDNAIEAELDAQVFAITNQLNFGIAHIQQPQERQQLSHLNLIAGKKAKASTAYNSALHYLQTGIQLLPNNPWKSDYSHTLNLYAEASEASYLSGELQIMMDYVQVVSEQAKSITDTARVYEIKIEADTIQGNLLAAIDTAMQFFGKVGIEFPTAPTHEDVLIALQDTQALLQGKVIAELIDLPEMENLEIRASLRVLAKVMTPAYLAKPELHRLLTLKGVSLSIQYGNTSTSAFVYSVYGLMLCGQPDSIPMGYEFGNLALEILTKFDGQEYEAVVLTIVYLFIAPWKEQVGETLNPLQRAYTTGLETGDLVYAGYAAYAYGFHSYIAGHELTQLADELSMYGSALGKINQQNALNYNNISHQSVLNLTQPNSTPWELVGTACDEKSMMELYEKINDSTGLWHFFVAKLTLCYLFDATEIGLEYVAKAKQYSAAGYAIVSTSILNFYDSLLHLSQFSTASTTEQKAILRQVDENQEILRKWADYAPMNQLHRLYLVKAEKHRVLGQKYEAADYYDLAIAQAQENQYIQEAALANECAAKFYLDWGKEKVAAGYLQEAYYGYSKWGAVTKADDLEARYPQLLQPILQAAVQPFSVFDTLASIAAPNLSMHCSSGPGSASSSSLNEALDLAAILKSSQSLAGTIQLDKLLHQLTQIILQDSGGDRCVLVLPNEADEWMVRAIVTADEMQLCAVSLTTDSNLPIKLIQYVKNTKEVVVSNDRETDLPVIDHYLRRCQPQSLLCLPILKQGLLIGILYLENHVARDVFTSNRIVVINFLCTQAAIALENARLYEKLENYSYTLEQKVEKRTQALCEKASQLESTLHQLYATQAQLIQTEKMSSLGQLVAGIAHEINNPISFIAGNLFHAKGYTTELLELSKFCQDHKQNLAPEIQERLEDIDLEFIHKDLSKLFNSMESGSDRIRNIVLSLRNFSRLDESELKSVDIHEGLESTLLLLQHRLKTQSDRPAIQIVKKYGDLPPSACYASQLNQVFMNLLVNAIDALEDAFRLSSDRDLCIEIETQVRFDESHPCILMHIVDNGLGMSEATQHRIFDPFFTTKPVGSGTGLGLAIAYQIVVEMHKGSLTCYSTPGKGTEFEIRIPIAIK